VTPVSIQTRLRDLVAGFGALALVVSANGCLALTPQLHPTDLESLEQLEDYGERNEAYNANAIYRHGDARGIRYVKGTQLGARPRNWQSLDLILRSDRNSAAALPEKKIRAARVLTGFLVASGVVLLGGLAASAREGLDLSRIAGTSAVMLAGGVATLGFGIATGVVWGQARRGYEDAVDVYNDSLALRLGIADAEGEYRPPSGVLVDEEGFIILEQPELMLPELRPAPPVKPPPATPPPAKPEAAPPAKPPPANPPPASPEAAPDLDDVEAPPEAEAQPEPDAEVPDRPPASGTASLVGPARDLVTAP
jgi:hypothetical protein